MRFCSDNELKINIPRVGAMKSNVVWPNLMGHAQKLGNTKNYLWKGPICISTAQF